jgi:hypothetical protein
MGNPKLIPPSREFSFINAAISGSLVGLPAQGLITFCRASMVLGQLPFPRQPGDLDAEADDGPEQSVQTLALDVQRPGLRAWSFIERDGTAEDVQEVCALVDELQGAVGMHGDIVPRRDQAGLRIP